MDYFTLMRAFWDFAFENPEKIKPNHCALYAFIVEQNNRLGWKKKFGLPTTMAKDAIGIRSYNTYSKTLDDLVNFGLIVLLEKSKNQYSSNIIALSKFNNAPDKALDKALIKHGTKQSESTVQSICSIDKQDTNTPIYNKLINEIPVFDEFLIYAKEKEPAVCPKALKLKYESWVANGWKDGNDNIIKNWKSKVCNTLPFIAKIPVQNLPTKRRVIS